MSCGGGGSEPSTSRHGMIWMGLIRIGPVRIGPVRIELIWIELMSSLASAEKVVGIWWIWYSSTGAPLRGEADGEP